METTASQRTSSAFRRARNMIRIAPTKGAQVMIERTGKEAMGYLGQRIQTMRTSTPSAMPYT